MTAVAEDRQPEVVDPPEPPPRLRWWREVAYVLGFYFVYSAIRNQFGSSTVSPAEAYENALLIIDAQRELGIFVELEVQRFFLEQEWFIRALNVFYGSLHFVATAAVMVLLYRRHPVHYVRWRSVLAWMTGLALIGFALFPLMPPRLMNAGGRWGWTSPEFDFVDTLVEVGGLWSFSSDGMQSISNQYAAMPSLHVGWAIWCVAALWAVTPRRAVRYSLVLYPTLTVFAIVVTGNHFLLDAVGGVVVLLLGYAAAVTWHRSVQPRISALVR